MFGYVHYGEDAFDSIELVSGERHRTNDDEHCTKFVDGRVIVFEGELAQDRTQESQTITAVTVC